MEHIRQYEALGAEYIRSQEAYFGNGDWSRQLVLERLGDVVGKNVIDAGCGHGVETRLILEQHPGKVIAFDPSSFMLTEAKKRTESPLVDFREGNFEQIPADDNSADVLVACFSLHYTNNLELAYNELHRVLKTGGHAVFVIPHPDDSHARRVEQGNVDLIEVKIYDKVVVRYPVHTMEEYVSPYVEQNFTISQAVEFLLPEVSKETPAVFAYTLTKR